MRATSDPTHDHPQHDYRRCHGRPPSCIHLTVRGPAGQEQEVEAIIDTGFDGWLSLPSSLVVRLGLVWRRRGRALLADGSESVFDIYEATVDWDGRARRIPVDEAETFPLVGMSLLEGYELKVQVQRGGNVTVRALLQAKSGSPSV